jgi:hypothetical protein
LETYLSIRIINSQNKNSVIRPKAKYNRSILFNVRIYKTLSVMGTLGSKARRLAKRQQYEATHPQASADSMTTADRPVMRTLKNGSQRLLKAN